MTTLPGGGDKLISDAIGVAQVRRTSTSALIRRSIVMFALHLAAFAGPFLVGFSWWMLGVALLAYMFLLQGSAGWLHRYFSHRCFRTSRWFQFVLAFWGGCASQRGALWWAAHHRRHHAFSDDTQDPHSPIQGGFLHSHMTWIWLDENQSTDSRWVKDLSRYPELRFLDRNYWVPPVFFFGFMAITGAVVAASSGSSPSGGAASLIVWGAAIPTVAAWHATFAINSVTHLWGKRRFKTRDESRNSLVVALFNLGEGWHNNHHHYPHAANSGFYWWEIDPVYYFMLFLEKTGLIWDVRKAGREQVEKMARRGTSSS